MALNKCLRVAIRSATGFSENQIKFYSIYKRDKKIKVQILKAITILLYFAKLLVYCNIDIRIQYQI